MYKISVLDKVSFILVIIGAINWGTIGLLNFNFVHFLFGILPIIERIIYILVFVAGINLVAIFVKSKFVMKKS
ncbi:DUF378 domain-containing protein [Clostridium sp. YIM B02551]|uniref:DUF378 domain-containing protein n=1 Tax=Clostridium sp. YIM B02551 TaxID=2910679 RepID=UPI001EEA2CFF|nr:DUF378 domain-containing protein [Clostridium sp. YIM B02551]